MFWAAFGAAMGAWSTTERGQGAENAITIFGIAMLAYFWLMYFRFKRQRAKSRKSRRLNG